MLADSATGCHVISPPWTAAFSLIKGRWSTRRSLPALKVLNLVSSLKCPLLPPPIPDKGLLPTAALPPPQSVCESYGCRGFLFGSLGPTLDFWRNDRISHLHMSTELLSAPRWPGGHSPAGSSHAFRRAPALTSPSSWSSDLLLNHSLVSPTHLVSGLSLHPLCSCQSA